MKTKHRTNERKTISVPVPVDVYEAVRPVRLADEAMQDAIARIVREYLVQRATPTRRRQKGAE